MEVLFIYLIIVLIFIIGIKKKQINEGFDYRTVKALRGLMAVEIVLGHMYGAFGTNNPILQINDRLGIFVVALFFSFSGYGLMKSKYKDEKYMNHFAIKQIYKIMSPFLLMYIFIVIYNVFVDGKEPFFEYIISDWFVIEIIILYIVWYVLFTFFNDKKATIIIILLTVIFNILAVQYNIGLNWYGSTISFSVGIIIYLYEEKIYTWITKHKVLNTMLLAVMYVIGAVLFYLGDKGTYIYGLAINILVNCVVFSVFIFTYYISIGNKVLYFLGGISWEIYIVHRKIIIEIGSKMKISDFYKIVFSFLIIFCFSYILNMITTRIKKILWG